MRSSGSGFFADLSADAAAITRLSSFDFPAPCAAKLKLVCEPALPVHNVLMPTELMIHVEDAAVSVRPARSREAALPEFSSLSFISKKPRIIRLFADCSARLKGRQWLGWRDLNARDDGVKVRCLTPWLQPNDKRAARRRNSPSCATSISYGVEDGTRTHGLQSHNLAL